ncbi:DEAD/DEAH box helicase family protein (plasmid) [Paenibacillus cellulosilyticus]|nr:DEAD/DEAH box helicase family protein [Paenibacillus cellulosilyticus]
MNVDKGNGRTERVVFGERGAGQNGKNIGFVEEECVRAVAARLYGRAALLSEAQELLAAGPPACQAVAAGGWSALAPALQWAALRGLVRLRCAVAPQQPTASPLGRLLLPAPMRRGRPWRRRCLRCGSGEARMNRTACAACGSSACAYCEACLTMGRSRECGLLIHGGGEAGLADAQGAAMSGAAPGLAASRAHRMHAPAAFAARWGLSPAQQAAAEAALSYVLPRLGGVRHSSSTNQNAPSRWAPARSITHHSASQPTICASLNQQAALSTADIPDTQPITSSHTRDTESSRPSSAPSVSQFLIWAVTGAGKTEMVFPLIEAALSFGGRALIATPRRDVVLELDPRLRRAFPGAAVVTLYGGSEQRWEDGDITIATTHQLFRFHERFDLVIIDELDAFPYHGDPQLHYAAAKAGVPGGAVILLSATPPRAMQKSVRKGQIGCARVPVRFHRHPLPVPQQIRMPRVAELLAKHKLPRLLLARLTSSLARGAQCFVFVQQIRHTEPLAQLLRTALPGIPIGATSSKDAERPQHVLAFRNREFRVLVTTTILERGVTVPFSDVFILDADGKLFDEASLVQMAGRAGRSKDDPNGRVYFFASTSNQSQRRAIAQIKSMNREAKKNGYLLPQ